MLFRSWGEACLYLSLDLSLYWEEYCLVRLSVVYRGRALPIIWRVLKHDSASVAFEAYREMLCQGAHRLPAGVKVVLLADRGFVHLKAMKMKRILIWPWCWPVPEPSVVVVPMPPSPKLTEKISP